KDQSEESKTELFGQISTLGKQKGEQQALLTESRLRQEQYEAQFAQLKEVEDQITSVITQAILKQFNEGLIPTNTPVKKGDIIGFQGHTGVATASHLHMGITYGATNPFGSGYFTGGALGQAVGSGSANQPLAGGVLTQGYHCSGGLGCYFIDLVSTSYGDQSGQLYWGEQINCIGYFIPAGWRSLRGEGAPVYAIKDGMVSKVTSDVCGGQYVIIDHGNGETSIYLHLK